MRTWLLIFIVSFSGNGFSQDSQLPNTQKLEVPFTTPKQALDSLKLPDGFTVTLFANEPNVNQPIAVTTDYRGRLWVVECLTYSDGRQNYDLELNDRVTIFEDTDNDGTFDKRKVFWDKGKKLTGIELGFGGVWLTAAPHLLFVPDADGDDQADGPAKVLLDGFNGDEIRHNIVNGLRWGPDGWLYGRHGIQATSHVGPPGSAPSQRTAMNCSIWRFHPISRKFQIVAEGGTNPWGFDFDDYGEMFMINTVIGHMFHIVPGARYRRMYGAHFNPHTYQVIEQTADHFHWDTAEEHWAVTKKEGMSSGTDAAGGGHAHTGLMCYLGDNWPERYRNHWFTANFHGRRINVERIERDGCGFTARHEADLIQSEDPWFRGIEMVYGPDGGVFLLDWSDIGECHENDGIHRTSGRIFKIKYGDSFTKSKIDMSKWSIQQLVECNEDDNQWFVRHARRILQERAAAGDNLDDAKQLIREIILSNIRRSKDDGEFDSRPVLRALWALHSIDATDQPFLLKLTEVNEEHIRAWAIRLLTDDSESLNEESKNRLTELAATDQSGLVRLYIASGLNHFDLQHDYSIYKALLQHESDQNDRIQPKLIWYRLEPDILDNIENSIGLIKDSKFPLIRENIARRITSEIDSHPEAVNDLIELLKSDQLEIVSTVAYGMKLALQGRTKVAKPDRWDEVCKYFEYSKNNNQKESKIAKAIESDLKKLSVIFGDGQGIAELKKIANDRKKSVASRRNAIEEYSATRPEKLFEFLKPLASDKAISNSVLKSMVFSQRKEVANVVINRFRHLDPTGKRIAIDTLTSRKPWTRRLLEAIEKRRIPKSSITAQHARQIANFDDEELSRKLANVWGTVRNSDASMLSEMSRVRKIYLQSNQFSHEQAVESYELGQKLFIEKCANCHVIFGSGANVGPDLTGGDRKNLNYLLENIIDPNSSVADSYRASKFVLADGRFLSGVVLQKNQQTTRIQTSTDIKVIENKDIEDSKPTDLSLMPEGLLQNLDDKDIRALFFYLSSDRK